MLEDDLREGHLEVRTQKDPPNGQNGLASYQIRLDVGHQRFYEWRGQNLASGLFGLAAEVLLLAETLDAED